MSSELLTQPVAHPKPVDERFTYNEFCARIKETETADLINGEIIMASPATIEHEISFISLGALLYFYVDYRQLGIVVGSRAAMKFSEHEAPEPDIMFIHKDRLHLWEDLPIDKHGIVRSEVLPGFWLRVDWLFAAEELDEMEILETILAGDPGTK